MGALIEELEMNTVVAFNSTKAKRALVEDVVYFCIEKLMPRMKTLDITIELSNDMDQADGYCLSETNRQFILEIDSRLKDDDLISCICHEMIHVKQHARNELKDHDLIFKRWKNELVVSLYTTIDEYMSKPWEEEAYRMQEVLLQQYKQERNL